MAFRGLLSVDEPAGERWALALERLAAGHPVVVRDVCIRLDEPGVVRVEVPSAWSDPARVTADVAETELGRAASMLDDLLARDAGLHELAHGRERVYELVIDYETGTVLVCTSRNGRLEWAPGTP